MRAIHLKYNSDNLLSEAEEIDLILKSAEDPSYFEPLYNKYFRQVYLFLFKRCANDVLAEELTSNTFFKAMKSISGYTPKGIPFGAWLYRIARNELLLHYRSQKYKRAVHSKLQDVEVLHDEIIEKEEKAHKLEWMKKALSTLSEEDLQLIEMKYFEHRQYDEIADITGLTIPNAKVKVHRIIKKLKKLVKQ